MTPDRHTEFGLLVARLSRELEDSTSTLRAATESATSQSSEAIGGLVARLTQETEKSTSTLQTIAYSAAHKSSEAIRGVI